MHADPELSVAGLAHDLNNVFETLSEVAEVLSGDPKWTKLANTIRRSVRRGERIVASLNETIAETGALNEILDNAIQHANDVLTFTRGTPIQCTRQFDAAVALPGSPAAWERVFVNLFLNAAQASAQETAIHVAAAAEGGTLALTVEDNGPGIPASILSTVFAPDVTTKKSRSRRGLGLHIVQTIVAEHGGSVEAANAESRGAVFTIRVPLTELS